MPKRARELSLLAVSQLKGDGRYAVGGAAGLYLSIKGNSRLWVLRISYGGRRHDMSLGPHPELSLADARHRALKIRRAVLEGRDPMQERRDKRALDIANARKMKTFSECAKEYINTQTPGWKSAKHAGQWWATLETYAFPVIGRLPVGAIDTTLVLDVLMPIWTTKTETASRVRGRIESILDWAKVRGYRDGENPARWVGNLRFQLPPRSRVRKVAHHAALPYVRMATFMAELRKHEGFSVRALEFAILTVARSSEVRGATWDEMDLTVHRWTIPADRMKLQREHVVPLSAPAIELLQKQPRLEGSALVFPSPNGRELSDAALGAVLDGLHASDIKRGGIGYLDPSQGRVATPHGLRSSFRDWAAEVAFFPSEVIEHALAHRLKDKAQAAYQRGTLLVKRAKLMEEWASYCSSATAGVSSNI